MHIASEIFSNRLIGSACLVISIAVLHLALRRYRRPGLRSKIMWSEHRLGVPPEQRSNLDYLTRPYSPPRSRGRRR